VGDLVQPSAPAGANWK